MSSTLGSEKAPDITEKLFLRHFTFRSSLSDESKTITISENSEYLPGHGSIIWAGSVIFSFHVLHSELFRVGLENKKILDLGSGCGMTAMAITMAYPSSCIVTSDLPSNLKHLVKMLQLNSLHSDSCCAMALDWNNPSNLSYLETETHHELSSSDIASKSTESYPTQSFDTIIGCEVVYHEPILLPLLNTIDYHLKPGGLVYFTSARHRHCYLQLFLELQERGYEVVRLETLSVPNIPSSCFDDSEKVQKELDKMKDHTAVYKGLSLGEITLTPSEELSVGWFSEGEFVYDLDKLVLVTARRKAF